MYIFFKSKVLGMLHFLSDKAVVGKKCSFSVHVSYNISKLVEFADCSQEMILKYALDKSQYKDDRKSHHMNAGNLFD